MRITLAICSLLLQTLFISNSQASALSETGRQRLTLSTEASIPPSPPEKNNDVERLLNSTLMALTKGQLETALTTINQLTESAPNFKLAYLIRGDILMAMAQRDNIAVTNTSPRVQSELKNYREEARKRLSRYVEHQPKQSLPDVFWRLDESVPYVLLVDTQKSRLFLYRNQHGQPIYVSDYYVTLGKHGVDKKVQGDKRTPLGVYSVASRLKRKLPDMYGDMAFPLSYPNEWDKHQKKTGSGIWLHGTPSNTYSRAPQDSDGCVVLANPELHALERLLEPGNAQIIIGHDFKWSPNASTAEKNSLLQSIEAWRNDWQSKRTERYLAHYSSRFFSQTTDYAGWAAYKRHIQTAPGTLSIALSKLNVLRYPDSQFKMAVVTFEQHYQTQAIHSIVQKRQYWIMEGQRWKILYEGPA